jgi:class 3 adenylate cyclase
LNGTQSVVLTFLIADVRGYSRFTEELGDEAAARLAAKFAAVAREVVEEHGGSFEAVRGDEGLGVFTSARQAIRAAVELEARFAQETEADAELPLRVGIGIDSGEAVRLEDGSHRGAALNVASRLCARAHGGDVIVSQATTRLAGRLDGLHYVDRGRAGLKNIADPVHIVQVYSELNAPAPRTVRGVLVGDRRTLWVLAVLVVLTAAVTAAGVAYLTAGETPAGTAAPLGAESELAPLVPAALWSDCRIQDVPDRGAIETAVCMPSGGMPDRWQISAYPNAAALRAAYDEELARDPRISRESGSCNAFSWGGELDWQHGVGRPGGRSFCYFAGNDAVIVWTHERLRQSNHRDVMMVARARGGDHVGLTRWWRPWHHLIGKARD